MQGVSRAGAALVCAGLVAALLLSMVLTNPSNLGPAGVTLWFLAFGVVLAANIALANYELIMRFGKETTKLTKHKTIMGCLRHGALLGGGLAVLLALSSLGQLDARDIGLVVVLIGLVEFYLRTRQ